MQNTKSGIFLTKPRKNSVLFGGRYINIMALARVTGMGQPTITQIFKGNRDPILTTARRMAAGLGMNMDQFCQALDARVKDYRERNQRLLSRYDGRLKKQQEDNSKRALAGLPVIPRIPMEKTLTPSKSA